MINICFNNKKLILKENPSIENPGAEEVKKYIDKINSENSPEELMISCHDEQETLIILFSFFSQVVAAGGVVMNNKDEILFIYRRGKWDLPKGKKDEGETTEKTALREVKEECGLKNHEIVKQLTPTYHTYREDDQTFLKVTYWYLMKTTDVHATPQAEEDIIKAEWKTKADQEEIFRNTFGSIKDVIKEVWN